MKRSASKSKELKATSRTDLEPSQDERALIDSELFNDLAEQEEADKVDFDAWFSMTRSERKLGSWERKAIKVYMKKQGLRDRELKKTYDDAYRKF